MYAQGRLLLDWEVLCPLISSFILDRIPMICVQCIDFFEMNFIYKYM